ncbi:MAG: alpha-mannosidase [Chloroflexi bacterium]|nr:alpha-mannosidase [Chloroflexota bacterium]
MKSQTAEKLLRLQREVGQAIYRDKRDIPAFKFHDGDCPDAAAADFDDRQWADFQIGSSWGGYDCVAWFRAQVPIPAEWAGQRLYLRFLVGPRDNGGSTAETLLYVNGEPLQALDYWHSEAWLPPEHLQENAITVALRAWSGVLRVPDRRVFRLAQLVWIDETTERFFHLSNTLLLVIAEMDEHSLPRIRLLQALDEAYSHLDFLHPRSERFYQSVAEAYAFLQEKLRGLEAPGEIKPRVVGIGHAHLDMAWLWRLRHTREKAVRTFTTALHLMRQYPEYCFLHSSPQLYKYLQQDEPVLYERIKERIAGCQWEVAGGTWIEPDVNLPDGESLVRQFLLGQQFLRRAFGQESRLLWLPDTFGFSAALPQIAVKSGMRYMLTTKMSWNQTNRVPYDTFLWRGIDGSELLTHFVTAQEYLEDEKKLTRGHTYNAGMYPAEVRTLWENYQQKELNDELLMVYGRGDGGGGPTKEMLEMARAMRNLPGWPSVELGKAESFFDRLEQRLAGNTLPVWDGELYPEFHRGTFTSQAQNKRANRKAETLFHVAEWLNALADIQTGAAEYPAEALHAGWELILLNQFHDILPGSSIRSVYEDSHKDYLEIAAIGRQAVASARERLFAALAPPEQSLVVLNPLSWERDGLVALPYVPALAGKTICDATGQPVPTQVVEEEAHPLDVIGEGQAPGGQALLVPVNGVPPLGFATFSLVSASVDAPPGESELVITSRRLENRFYRIELNERGQISSLWDKEHGRDVMAAGERGNVFQAFLDKPLHFDAWDIDAFYQERMDEVGELVEAVVEENGPLRGALRLVWQYDASRITQRLTLYRDSRRIDFRTEVDWRQQDVLLKVAFPVAIRATQATFDVQFGAVERPTHWNTTWDAARFEVPAHKWADLSEGDYGVALLNDCKYGYDVRDHVLRLTLIKSARYPDEQADQGQHRFTYSLWPHAGGWRQGDVKRQGYELNAPLLAGLAGGEGDSGLPSRASLAQVDTPHVILETVKRAEDGDGWIIRLYEAQQTRTQKVTVTFDRPVLRAVACNLLEEEEADPSLHVEGRQLSFAILAYEIRTFRVTLAPGQ